MQEELLQRLDALAAKLGVGAGHMWEVLVRQSYIVAFEWLLSLVLAVVAGLLLWKAKEKHEAKSRYSDLIPEPLPAFPVLAVGLWFIISFVALLTDVIPRLLNPEYFALRTIFGG